jgi:hypothetical protein
VLSRTGGRSVRWAARLLYAALCLAVAVVTVAQIKHNSVIHCPRDLALYNGDQPYIRLFDPVQDGVEPGHCWPGGHSSGGFALMSLYFVFRRARPRLALAWLVGGFLYGFGLGFGRVVQGAHLSAQPVGGRGVLDRRAGLYAGVLRRHGAAPGGGVQGGQSAGRDVLAADTRGGGPGSPLAAPGTPLASAAPCPIASPYATKPRAAEPCPRTEVSLLFCDVVRSTELTRRSAIGGLQ